MLETLLLGIALGSDAFAVGLGVGTRYSAAPHILRLSLSFGFAQWFMPLVGWFVGKRLVVFASQWAPWIAFTMLVLLGIKMIKDGIGAVESGDDTLDPTKGLMVFVLSLATSLDALGVGFSYGITARSLFVSSIFIGIITALMTVAAMKLGSRLSQSYGRKVGCLGGAILLAIAVRIVL